MATDAVTNLYTTIKTKVKLIEAEVGEGEDAKKLVTHFSFWNSNDLDKVFQAKERAVAVFFNILGGIPWKTTNDPATKAFNEEHATCTFIIRVARQSLKADEDSTLELLAARNCIHRNLIGLKGDNFGFMKRVGDAQDIQHNNVSYWQMKYTCDLYEFPTETDRTGVEGTVLNLNTSFQV